MFGADAIMAQATGLFNRMLDYFLGTGRLRQFAHSQQIGTALQEFFHFKAYLAKIDIQIC